jgi:glutathione S-transferase
VEYDTDSGATRTSEFLGRVNPNGRVPVLELEDGRCLAESNAILWYLAEGTRFLPGAEVRDPERARWERAEGMQWMCFEQYSHEPHIATVRHWITHKIEMTPERVAALPGKRRWGAAALAVMEQHLARRTFFVGERYSIADIALYAYTHVAPEGGFDLAPCPAVRAWIARVAAEPGHLAITA